MSLSSKKKTDKIRTERAALGQKRREFSLTDAEFKLTKEFVKNLRNKDEQSI